MEQRSDGSNVWLFESLDVSVHIFSGEIVDNMFSGPELCHRRGFTVVLDNTNVSSSCVVRLVLSKTCKFESSDHKSDFIQDIITSCGSDKAEYPVDGIGGSVAVFDRHECVWIR